MSKEVMELSEEMGQRKRRKKPVSIVIMVVVALLVVLAAVFIIFASRYKDRFLKNTYINGIYVGDMTPEEANAAVAATMPDYSIELKFRDGAKETVYGKDFGFKYDAIDDIEELLYMQIPLDFIKDAFGKGETREYTVDMKKTYNEAELENLIKALPEVQDNNMKDPKDAYVDYDKEKGVFVLVKEDEGSVIKVDALVDEVKNSVGEFDLMLDVQNEKLYEEAKVKSDDNDMKSLLETMNGCVGGITFELNDSKVVLDKDTLVSWLKKDKDGHYYKDPELWDKKLDEFIDKLEEAVNNDSNGYTFEATDFGTVHITGGDFVKKLNKDAEKHQIMKDLEKPESVSRGPILVTADGATTNHGIGGTYVEIDVSRQHLWAYDKGVCWMDTDIVTGKATSDRYTPQGVYVLDFKTEDTELRGRMLENGAYEYEVHVDYWMPFNEDIGMHDASWVYSFGGNTYLWGGSRGCINMPVDMAPLMYQWIDYDIPIICYYSEDPVFID